MNSTTLRSAILAIGCWLSAFPVLAHPGHPLRTAPPQHLLTSPDHLIVLVAGGTVLWLTGLFVQRRLPRQFLQGAGLAAILIAAFI
jgi:hypothetical protein